MGGYEEEGPEQHGGKAKILRTRSCATLKTGIPGSSSMGLERGYTECKKAGWQGKESNISYRKVAFGWQGV